MNILFATGHFGFLRNMESALAELAGRGHTIEFMADRSDRLGGDAILARLQASSDRLTKVRGPSFKHDPWYGLGTGMRLALDYWRYLEPEYRSSPKLRARGAEQAPDLAVQLGSAPLLRTRPGRALMRGLVRHLETSVPSPSSVLEFLEKRRPDLLIVTPLLYFGSPQVHYVRAARRLGIRSVLAVGSWDHLTTKGLIHEIPDDLLVWNRHQAGEARFLHGVPAHRVHVTGAQAYDHWFRAQPNRSREALCAELGFDASQEILLYLCSSPFITPYEVDHVRRWIRGLRKSGSDRLERANVLVRPHPQNADQWSNADLSGLGAVRVWPGAGANPIDGDSRADYFDSMYHAAVVIGVNTSAQIESAIVGRPVFAVPSGEFASTQEGTLHFRLLQRAGGGLVYHASDEDEHYRQLAAHATGADPKGRAFVEDFVRPNGLETPAAVHFADAVEAIGATPAPAPVPTPRFRAVERRLLAPLAAVARAATRRAKEARTRATADTGGPRRLLFVLGSPEYLRYYDSALRELAARGHRVLLAVDHQKDAKLTRLKTIADHPGIETLGIVPLGTGFWRGVGRGLRGTADFVRYWHPRLAGARALRQRIKRKVLPPALRWLDWIPKAPASVVAFVQRALGFLEGAVPVPRAVLEFVGACRPDAVLVSPLIDAASDQVEVVKAARRLGTPVAACIASWDNLTNKGNLRVPVDRVIVWNEIQRAEATELHGVPGERVLVTGAQLFDRWFDQRPSTDRETFCAMVGLRTTRPFVLFTGSSPFISRSDEEVAFVRHWVQALRECATPEVAELSVLVRPHPYNTAAWVHPDLGDLEDVAVWPRERTDMVADEVRAAYFDSLYHARAVVGVNTSAMVEAAIVGRPVLSIDTEEFAGTQAGTLHFHYLLDQNGGCVILARDLQEHAGQLAAVLGENREYRARQRQFVRRFVRPHGLDRAATPMFADAAEAVAALPSRPMRRGPVQIAVRVPLAVSAVLVAGLGVVVQPKRLGRWFRRARKPLKMWLHRTRKRTRKALRTPSRSRRRPSAGAGAPKRPAKRRAQR